MIRSMQEAMDWIIDSLSRKKGSFSVARVPATLIGKNALMLVAGAPTVVARTGTGYIVCLGLPIEQVQRLHDECAEVLREQAKMQGPS